MERVQQIFAIGECPSKPISPGLILFLQDHRRGFVRNL